MKKDTGISEVLGSLLLIAVFVTAFSIVTVTYLSQPLPEKIPEVSFDFYIDDESTIHLIHAGGDSLKTYNAAGKDASSNAEYYIRVDYSDNTTDDTIWDIADVDETDITKKLVNRGGNSVQTNIDYLEPGEGFKIQPDSLPETIHVIYKIPSGSEAVLWSGRIEQLAGIGGGSIGDINLIGLNGAYRICVNDVVNFTDASVANIKYSGWDFDANINPGIDSIKIDDSWVYSVPGLYTVIHNITTVEGYEFTKTEPDYIDVRPVHADFYGQRWSLLENNAEPCDPDPDKAPVCSYCTQRYPGKPCGKEPLYIKFIDTSFCNPTGWNWIFGDGQTSTDHNPVHEYLYGTGDYSSPKLYSVNLTVSNSGGYDTLTRSDYVVVLPDCFEPTADFSYDGLVDYNGNMAVTFTDHSTADPDKIVSWEWDFGDGSFNSIEQNPPVHEYDGGKSYSVTLTVTNDCGRSDSKSRLLTFPCDILTARMDANPPTGASPLEVTFTDQSYDQSGSTENITSWRWSFGDGTYYYTENKDNPNPPPHTYTRVGTFHASLVVQNNCGQGFAKAQVIVASKEASIAGTVWDDKDEEGDRDAGEPGLSGWPVYLDERRNGQWEQVDVNWTDVDGLYKFELVGVSNSVFRVRQDLENRSGETWRTTYSHGTVKEEVSDNILIYDTRHYSGIDFGNIKLHRSKISIPGKFTCYGGGWMDGVFYYSSLSSSAEFLDYNTSYNTNPRVVFLNPSSTTGTFTPDPVGGYPNGYTSWGDSSYILTFREYNNYLKRVGYGAYFLDWWQYPIGTNYYKGKDFPVPDDTIITADQLKLTYKWDESIHFAIDKPKDGDIIPYTPSYTVEAHFEGKGEQTSQCYLISPVSNQIFYNSTVGEYLVTNINTRPYEGKRKLFTARMKLSTYPYPYVYTYSNASIAFEETTATITGITSEATWPPYVKGNATVTASVNGKWQVNTSSVLYVDGEPVTTMTMTTPGLPSTLQGTFDVEPYAGRTIPVFVRVPYNPTHTDEIGSVINIMGLYEDSPAVNITVLSKKPIDANFTAYPWSGRAPHEVAFTDTSKGGANQWDWDFNDGGISELQHPIHVFDKEGIYPIRLTVTNASAMTDFIEQNITVLGVWKNTTILTNRYSTLAAEGMMTFITHGANSDVTINGTRYALPDGDIVTISLDQKLENAKIFIAGAISECNLTSAVLTVNGEFINQGPISDILIQDFENFHSNLTLSDERSYIRWITFEWEGVAIPVSWKRTLIVEDLKPTLERFMNLELSPSQTHFDGMAGTYNII